jgi:hypothetical protein
MMWMLVEKNWSMVEKHISPFLEDHSVRMNQPQDLISLDFQGVALPLTQDL